MSQQNRVGAALLGGWTHPSSPAGDPTGSLAEPVWRVEASMGGAWRDCSHLPGRAPEPSCLCRYSPSILPPHCFKCQLSLLKFRFLSMKTLVLPLFVFFNFSLFLSFTLTFATWPAQCALPGIQGVQGCLRVVGLLMSLRFSYIVSSESDNSVLFKAPRSLSSSISDFVLFCVLKYGPAAK